MERTHRGFGIFGRVTDSRGLIVRVQESSIAFEGPHVWIFFEDAAGNTAKCQDFVPYGKPEAWREHQPHANVELIALLQDFVRAARAGELMEHEGEDH